MTKVVGTTLRKKINSNIWRKLDNLIEEKFKNLAGKTAQYKVPTKFFQKRTSRENRVLIPWKVVKNNQLTIKHLETFFGGVCVEFVNYDFIKSENINDEVFKFSKNKLGFDGLISSMISFRTESGDSGARISRKSYNEFVKLIKEGELKLELEPLVRDKTVKYSGKGDNSVWKGNFFCGIKGGTQKSILSHYGTSLKKVEKAIVSDQITDQLIFNPATEYANKQICNDITIQMSFFAMHCYDINKDNYENFDLIKKECQKYLIQRNFDDGNLYEYCIQHPSLKFGNGILIDPIRFKKISINNFKGEGKADSVVLSHNEAANKDLFYFDETNQYILSPARPMNLFWSTHWSNMMQQDNKIEEFWIKENKRVEKRNSIVSK